MTDERENPLRRLTDHIEGEMKEREFKTWPFKAPDALPKTSSDIAPRTEAAAKAVPTAPNHVIKNEDVPRAGELSSQVFNDLTTRIIEEMRETAESQLNDAINRKHSALAVMDELRAEVEKTYSQFESSMRAHQDKVKKIAGSVQDKVKKETDQMKALSNRLRSFADSMNNAHETFFNGDDEK
jgi:uncharacterized coiled-coil protein SlyX